MLLLLGKAQSFQATHGGSQACTELYDPALRHHIWLPNDIITISSLLPGYLAPVFCTPVCQQLLFAAGASSHSFQKLPDLAVTPKSTITSIL